MPNKRAGITVSLAGKEHPWGYWRWEESEQNPFVQRAGGMLNQLEHLAAPTFHMYRGIIEKQRDLIIPAPEIRLANVRQNLRQLGIINSNIDKIAEDLTKWAAQTFRPFNHSWDAGSKEPRKSFQGRVELRNILRSLDAHARAKALKDDEFISAALEQVPQASGLSKAEHDMLRLSVLEARYPHELHVEREGKEAIDTVRLASKASNVLFTNELAELGQPAVEAPTPKFASTFSGALAHSGNGSAATQ